MTVKATLDPDLSLQGERLIEALLFWQSARGPRKMPTHQDVDPIRMPRILLPHLELVEIIHEPGPRFRWRLIGTHVTRAVDRDATGKFFDELYDGEVFDTIRQPFAWVAEHGEPVRWHGRSSFVETDWLNYEGVYLPLSDDETSVNMVLAAVQYDL